MSDSDIALIATSVISTGAAVVGWARWLYEVREKKAEKALRLAAEETLRVIKRRAAGPYFAICETRFDIMYLPGASETSIGFLKAGSGQVLCFLRNEVNPDSAKTKGHVVMVIENLGETSRKTRLTLNSEPVELIKEPEIDDSHGLFAIAYPYHQEQHGKEQELLVWFQAESGVEDTHKYRLRHGFRGLERVDPA